MFATRLLFVNVAANNFQRLCFLLFWTFKIRFLKIFHYCCCENPFLFISRCFIEFIDLSHFSFYFCFALVSLLSRRQYICVCYALNFPLTSTNKQKAVMDEWVQRIFLVDIIIVLWIEHVFLSMFYSFIPILLKNATQFGHVKPTDIMSWFMWTWNTWMKCSRKTKVKQTECIFAGHRA